MSSKLALAGYTQGKSDPSVWLSLFNRWCIIENGQNVEEAFKLSCVVFVLPEPLVLWFNENNFQTWEAFTKEFLQKEAKKISVKKVFLELNSIKRNSTETAEQYIDRFKKIHRDYLTIRDRLLVNEEPNTAVLGEEGLFVQIKETNFIDYFIPPDRQNDCVNTSRALDDVQLYSANIQEHFGHLEAYFRRLLEVNMRLNSNKCEFFTNKVELLGFEVIPSVGIRPVKSKVCLRSSSSPGRKHVHQFAFLAAPLNDLLKKNVPFVWSKKCQQAFDNLKQALVDATMLRFPNPNLPFRVYTDASDIGIGVALTQIDPDVEEGAEMPVCFLSRKLQAAEVRYPIVEKELLAIIYALDKLRKYLVDRPFTLFCDNTAVCYMFSKHNPNQRLQRWVMATQEFTFEIKHVPSKKNPVSDALSRYPGEDDQPDGETSADNLLDHMLIDEQVALKERYEEELLKMYEYLRDPAHHLDCNVQTKKKALKYRVYDDRLYRKVGQRWVKIPYIRERQDVLVELHDGHGHFGQQATWARVYKNYWWPGVYNMVREFVRTCKPCQLFGDKYDTNPPKRRVVQGLRLFEQFSIDFVGPFPESKAGNRYLLVASEGFTRWPVAVATKAADADTVATFLYRHIFTVFGPPTHLLSDNGTHFDNEVIDKFLAIIKTHHQFSAPYRPQTNGRCEKLNGTLGKAIKKLVYSNPSNWDDHIDAVLYAYRTKAHAVVNVSAVKSV